MPDTLDHFHRLIDHLEWADARALGALEGAPPDAVARSGELYAHLLGAEHVWLSRLEQRPPSVAVWPALSLGDARSLAAENVAGYRALLARLSAADLARDVPYTNSAGQSFRSTVADILLQVALHGSYHRGQVALLLRASGAEPAPTDYITFARGAPAATRK